MLSSKTFTSQNKMQIYKYVGFCPKRTNKKMTKCLLLKFNQNELENVHICKIHAWLLRNGRSVILITRGAILQLQRKQKENNIFKKIRIEKVRTQKMVTEKKSSIGVEADILSTKELPKLCVS